MKLKRCAIYIRVSTAEQMMHGKSLQAQRECLENYAADHDMIVAGVYADEGKTARKELKKRKAIHRLLEDVKQDKIDVIIFWRLDRWFRNLSDFYKVQDILDEYGVSWISISEPGINMETRDGRLQLNVVLSIGQNEVDTTSERIKFVNESSIRQGKLIFGDANMPIGYKTGIADGTKRMVKDEDQAPMVEEFFKYYRLHQNKMSTIKHMQEMFDFEFTYAHLRTMLSSEFYKGTYRGIPYCPAYLTEQEWDEIQAISKKNVKITPSGRVYYFSGLIKCPCCNTKMAGTGMNSIINRKTREKRTYTYYRCNKAFRDAQCSNRHRLSQNLIEKYLLENLEVEYRKYVIRQKKVYEQKVLKKKARTPQKIQDELDRLNKLFQAGRIEWDYYNSEYDRLEDELAKVLNPEPSHQRDLGYLENLFETDFRSMYDRLDNENKRAFWRGCIREIKLTPDNTVDQVDFL